MSCQCHFLTFNVDSRTAELTCVQIQNDAVHLEGKLQKSGNVFLWRYDFFAIGSVNVNFNRFNLG